MLKISSQNQAKRAMHDFVGAERQQETKVHVQIIKVIPK